jgi:cbb3-type cytochrome oxidase cytochrome c subunit
LDDVGSKRDAEWLRTYLTEPKQALPEAKMPKLPFNQKEMADMIAFMMSLKADREL